MTTPEPVRPPSPIAVLGLGQMGTAVSVRLLDAGYQVRGCDVDADARERATRIGVEVGDRPADAVAGAAAVVTFLPDASVVSAVADEVLDAAGPGTCWLEMSSSHPAVTRDLATRAAERDIGLVDAPVAGGVAGAEQGTLTVMVAAPAELRAAVQPVLEVLGQRIIAVSERPGDGDLTKAINNLLAAANLALATEGLVLGLAEGLDLETLLDVLNAGSATSFATRTQIPNFVLTGRFDARFTVAQYAKDVDVALDVAARRGLTLDMAARAQEVWRALARERGREDYTRIVPITAAAGGVELPATRQAGA